jgi:hypothetical protein
MAHRVPREPTVHRVGVWRKLKRLGAILINDSVWVLPANVRTREHLRWIAAEVEEADGEALIWESDTLVHGDEGDLRRRFLEQVEPGYAELLAELKTRPDEVEPIARRYRQLRDRDHFHSAVGRRVRDALLATKGEQRR